MAPRCSPAGRSSPRSPPSGIESFRELGGSSWVVARDAIRHQTLRAGNKEATDVASGWLRFNDYLALEFTQDVGQRVTVVRLRSTTEECLLKDGRAELADAGTMTARLSVPGAVSDLDVKADLRAQQVAVSAAIDAPRDGRPLPRITWLLRQLKDAPAQLRVDVAFANAREISSALLIDAVKNPSRERSRSGWERDRVCRAARRRERVAPIDRRRNVVVATDPEPRRL